MGVPLSPGAPVYDARRDGAEGPLGSNQGAFVYPRTRHPGTLNCRPARVRLVVGVPTSEVASEAPPPHAGVGGASCMLTSAREETCSGQAPDRVAFLLRSASEAPPF